MPARHRHWKSAADVCRRPPRDDAACFARAERALLAAMGGRQGPAFGGRWSRLITNLPLAIKPPGSAAESAARPRPTSRAPRLAGSRLAARVALLGLPTPVAVAGRFTGEGQAACGDASP
jgi:hypothetical protein